MEKFTKTLLKLEELFVEYTKEITSSVTRNTEEVRGTKGTTQDMNNKPELQSQFGRFAIGTVSEIALIKAQILDLEIRIEELENKQEKPQ